MLESRESDNGAESCIGVADGADMLEVVELGDSPSLVLRDGVNKLVT